VQLPQQVAGIALQAGHALGRAGWHCAHIELEQPIQPRDRGKIRGQPDGSHGLARDQKGHQFAMHGEVFQQQRLGVEIGLDRLAAHLPERRVARVAGVAHQQPVPGCSDRSLQRQ
jgi:hypothetical protein